MTFDEWFQSKHGEPYDSMYVFARDAWKAARADAFQLAAERARDIGQELAALNDDDSMAFAGNTIGDSICKRSNEQANSAGACASPGSEATES